MKANYFLHDNNMMNSPKIIKLRIDMGIEGYGIYCMLLEMINAADDLHLEADYKYLAKIIQPSSRNRRQEKIRKVCEDYNLFDIVFDNNTGKKYLSVPDLSQINPKFVPDLSQVNPSSVPDLSQIDPKFVPDLSQVNPSSVPDLSQIDPKFVPDLSQIDPKFVPNLSQICPKFVPKNANDTLSSNCKGEKIKENGSKIGEEKIIDSFESNFDDGVEKEKRKEKENFPHTPYKEKENKKEKEIAADDARACTCVRVRERAESENEKKIQPTFEEEFRKPQKDELQRCRNDWRGDDVARFEKNLQEIFQSEMFKKFSKKKYAVFSASEKRKIVDEFILRNATEMRYTQIFFDRDYQNNMRQHFINFLDAKMRIMQDRQQNQRPKSITQEAADLLKQQGVML